MSSNILLLSIRPKYADKIFDQTKTVELRRVCPRRLEKGDLVLIYVSSPTQAVVGAFKVEKIVEKPVTLLWQMVKTKAGLKRSEFDAYYRGIEIGVGIFFKQFWPLNSPISLKIMKEQDIGFQPPQSFRYTTTGELERAFPQFKELLARVHHFQL